MGGIDASGMGRLLRLRRLEEGAAEEDLVEARQAWTHSVGLQRAFEGELRQLDRARLRKLAEGDREGSTWDEQSMPALEACVERMLPRVAVEQRQVTRAADVYTEAHRERQKLEHLVEAGQRRLLVQQEKREQRTLDDLYLAGRLRRRAPGIRRGREDGNEIHGGLQH